MRVLASIPPSSSRTLTCLADTYTHLSQLWWLRCRRSRDPYKPHHLIYWVLDNGHKTQYHGFVLSIGRRKIWLLILHLCGIVSFHDSVAAYRDIIRNQKAGIAAYSTIRQLTFCSSYIVIGKRIYFSRTSRKTTLKLPRYYYSHLCRRALLPEFFKEI